MSAVAIRIGLRYVAAFLVSHGLMAEGVTDFVYDPDLSEMVQVGLGAVTAGAAEGWYYLAHRFGWAK